MGAVLAAPGYEDADDAGSDDGAVDDIVLAAALKDDGLYFCDVLEYAGMNWYSHSPVGFCLPR